MSNRLEDASYRSGVIVAMMQTLMDDVDTSPSITNKQAILELYNRCVVKLGCVYLLNGWEAEIWDEVNVLMSYTNAKLDDICECQFDETTFTAGYSKGIIFTKKIAEAKNFGEGLYYVRWLAGVALKDVSKEVRIPLPALYQYEGGGRMPNLERFIILLRYYMCSEKLLVRLIYNGACK